VGWRPRPSGRQYSGRGSPLPLCMIRPDEGRWIAAGKSLHIARAPRSAEYIDVEPTGNPAGRPKRLPEFAPNADDPDGADRRTVGNLVIEARKFSGLAVDTLVELTKDNHADSTRFAGNDCPT
jgi:hypothetical protein